MGEVNERIKKKLDSEEWDKAKPKFDYSFSIGTLEGKSRRRSKPRGGARPGRKQERDSWSFDSKKKEKKDKKESAKPKSPEPLVDTFESEEGIRVVAMFPKVNQKEELEVNLEEGRLFLKTSEYEEVVEVPFPVDKNPEISYKNGIFDIKFEKKQA
ncbi:hypothetical protein KGY63_02240 [Candidatus Bipolaricaulota bacterium]|nr:hypothetical protein [Candidatus Bipolaricaulota bacterium]MBS3814185.1 hypothetical protein [Candidatus Bipolaricaulota bacterium]